MEAKLNNHGEEILVRRTPEKIEEQKMIRRILKKASEITKNHDVKCINCVERTFEELTDEGYVFDKTLIKDIFCQTWEDPTEDEWKYLNQKEVI